MNKIHTNPLLEILINSEEILSELDRHFELHNIKTKDGSSLNQFFRIKSNNIIINTKKVIQTVCTQNDALYRLCENNRKQLSTACLYLKKKSNDKGRA